MLVHSKTTRNRSQEAQTAGALRVTAGEATPMGYTCPHAEACFKEYNQGVAYLDDGTMVVVDNTRQMLGKNIDIQVTSVLQTTAEKMIFGRYEVESSDVEGDYARQKVSRL